MRTGLTIFLAGILSGCSFFIVEQSSIEARMAADDSSMQLCDRLLNDRFATNMIRDAAIEVLNERGEDCSQYLHLRNPEQNVNVDINSN